MPSHVGKPHEDLIDFHKEKKRDKNESLREGSRVSFMPFVMGPWHPENTANSIVGTNEDRETFRRY